MRNPQVFEVSPYQPIRAEWLLWLEASCQYLGALGYLVKMQ